MEEDKIISQLKGLKSIKPREEWVSLVKTQIFQSSPIMDNKKSTFATFIETIKSATTQNRFAYALPAFLLLFGVLVAMKFDLPYNGLNILKGSTASVSEVTVKDNLENFKAKSHTLAEVQKSNTQQVPSAAEQLKEAAKNLTDIVKKDPEAAKAVALDVNNNKTYLDVQDNTDVKVASDELYQAIDKQMIDDLKSTNLNADQKKSLDYIVGLYNDSKYSAALENILLFNISREKK